MTICDHCKQPGKLMRFAIGVFLDHGDKYHVTKITKVVACHTPLYIDLCPTCLEQIIAVVESVTSNISNSGRAV